MSVINVFYRQGIDHGSILKVKAVAYRTYMVEGSTFKREQKQNTFKRTREFVDFAHYYEEDFHFTLC